MASLAKSLKEKQRQEREQLIIQAAKEIFLEKGYYETTVDEIAARVGIAKGTIYLHFPGKEDILLAMFFHEWQETSEKIIALMKDVPEPRKRLEAYIEFSLTHFQKKKQTWVMLGRQEIPRLLQEGKGGRFLEIWRGLYEWLVEQCEQGQKDGSIRTDIPAEAIIRTMSTMLGVQNHPNFADRPQFEPKEMSRYLISIFFDGVATHPER